MAFSERSYVSPEEYLDRERVSGHKSEYFQGEIFAMAGGSPAHNRITANLIREIDSRLLGGPCITYTSDQRVKVTATELYTYPDVVVVCGEPQFEAGGLDTLLNPTLLVEVLSPSTEAYDRGAKFGHFRRLPTLQEYVLVSQDRARVERYQRHGERWELTAFDGLDAALLLTTVPGEIPLSRLYDRVSLPDNPGR
jgi:Uma2 family endonuclease